jgi:hypothetical protein
MLRGHNLTSAVLVKRLKVDGTNYTAAAGQTALTSESHNVGCRSSARFLLSLGAITSGAVTSIKAQQAEDDGAGSPQASWADIEGSSITIADTDDSKTVSLEIVHPAKPHLRVVTSRATQDSVIDALHIEVAGDAVPVTQPSNSVGNEIHVCPDEGTA